MSLFLCWPQHRERTLKRHTDNGCDDSKGSQTLAESEARSSVPCTGSGWGSCSLAFSSSLLLPPFRHVLLLDSFPASSCPLISWGMALGLVGKTQVPPGSLLLFMCIHIRMGFGVSGIIVPEQGHPLLLRPPLLHQGKQPTCAC